MVHQLTKFQVLRVDMVINPPWNLPFLGAKGLTSPEQTATGTDISTIIRKPSKTGKHEHENRKSTKEAKDSKPKPRKVKKSKLWSTFSQPWSTEVNPQKDRSSKVTTLVPQDDNSSDQQQNGRVNYVKSSTLIGSLKPHGLKEAQEKRGFALIALTKEAHMSLSRIAKLAIRVSSFVIQGLLLTLK
ncbi:hypothetical protein Tco_0235712 [Tanacetum coccineum]